MNDEIQFRAFKKVLVFQIHTSFALHLKTTWLIVYRILQILLVSYTRLVSVVLFTSNSEFEPRVGLYLKETRRIMYNYFWVLVFRKQCLVIVLITQFLSRS